MADCLEVIWKPNLLFGQGKHKKYYLMERFIRHKIHVYIQSIMLTNQIISGLLSKRSKTCFKTNFTRRPVSVLIFS